MYSTGLWGNDKIRTLDDLELEMAEEEAAAAQDDDGVDGGRDDLSDDEIVEKRYKEFASKVLSSRDAASSGADGQMSVAEMQEIIESQKRQIKKLTEQCKQHEEEKASIFESFK